MAKAWLWDTRTLSDALSGIAVNTLGHAHPRFTAALSEQIGKLIHCSNIYQVREQELLADKLCSPPTCRKCSSATPAARRMRPRSGWHACTVISKASNPPRSS
jgi:acetylornithine/succinyldiaminopimelate/putrescine aminotransferase